jgi:5-methyltetrahydrofolate--homocysteine methyltransferase
MDLKTIYQSVLDGETENVEKGVQVALSEGISAGDILNQGLISAMDEVGRQFEEGDLYVPEMLVSARAMQAGLKFLKPHLAQSEIKSSGKIAVGTVKGDLHDIGKNLVAMMLEGAGFEVIDLGVNVSPEVFVEAVQEGAQLIGMSALLTTTMSNMSATIEALKTAGVRDQVKVIIGGAPVTEEYAKQIGADGFGTDASSATRVARLMME